MKNKILISEGIKIKMKEIKKEDTKNKFLNNYENKKDLGCRWISQK